jgi:putative membrane protein
MAESLFRRTTGKAIVLGMLAGAIGGLAGSGAKIVGELIYEPRTQGQVPPPLLLAEKVEGHPIPKSEQGPVIQAIHWSFGAATGAVYGAAAEVAPVVTIGYGVVFGLVLQLFTHESAVPALGLDVPASQQPVREHVSEFFSHALYGLATEAVRRLVRKRLLPGG